MNLRKIIKEEVDEFDWAKGDVTYTIDFILGKKMFYRENNLGDLEHKYKASIFDFNRWDIKFGEIKDNPFWVTKVKGDDAIITLSIGDKIDYKISEVEQYVNLGVWVLLDERGDILNDFSR